MLKSFGIELTVPNLIRALRHDNSLIQINAAMVLGRMKEQTAIPALEASLADESQSVRIAAADALLNMGNKTGLTVLTDALKSEDKDIAVIAASTLCTKSIPAGFQTLKSLVSADQAHIRRLALLNMDGCAGYADEKKGIFLKATRDENKEVRLTALESLSRAPDQSVVDVLIKTLRDGDEVIRYAADKWLKQITQRSFNFRHTDPPEKREEAIGKWESWWRNNRDGFEFNR